jgi:hypothetical protein
VSVDRVDAKVLRARGVIAWSDRAIAAAHGDLERPRLRPDRHCTASAENIELCERRLISKLPAYKRLGLGLYRIGLTNCLALLHLIARLLPSVRDLFLSIASWLRALARRTRKHVGSCLSAWRPIHATKDHNKSRHHCRIAGLDGPLCIGQPASSSVVPKSETGLLKVRLIVGTFVAVIVGFLAAASTYNTYEQPAGTSPSVTSDLPPVASNHSKKAERLAPDPILGFSTVTEVPATQHVSPKGATIAEMISIMRPLPDTPEQPEAATEAADITLPARKPKLKIEVKSKRSPTTEKHQLTLWEQLPWLR